MTVNANTAIPPHMDAQQDFDKSRQRTDIREPRTRAVNELLGKKYLFYSSSQEGVRYFLSQEGATRIFPRKGVFT